jgi:hypothetical protein
LKEIEDLEEEKINWERRHFERIIIVIVLGFFIRFLVGFFSYNHLVRFTPEHLDWKKLVFALKTNRGQSENSKINNFLES